MERRRRKKVCTAILRATQDCDSGPFGYEMRRIERIKTQVWTEDPDVTGEEIEEVLGMELGAILGVLQ